eukprot:2706352-Amphidinium_carterae.1
MTSATAVVRAGTSLRKRTGEPLDDGHRTLDRFAGYEPNKTDKVDLPDYSRFRFTRPEHVRRLWENERTSRRTNSTKPWMTFRLSQLAVEMKKVEDTTGAQVTQMRLALTKKQNLRLPTDENQRLRTEMGRLEALAVKPGEGVAPAAYGCLPTCFEGHETRGTLVPGRCWWTLRLYVNTMLTSWQR